MSNFFRVSNVTSLDSEVVPYVTDQLEASGYAILRLGQNAHIASELLVVSAFVGRRLGSHFSYNFIEGESEQSYLAAHTEGISYTSGIVPYFALACVKPAVEGGATRIFDARKAAVHVREIGMADVLMEYGSLAHPNQVVRYSLVVDDPTYGKVLRYRSRVVTNKMAEDTFLEDEVYQAVNDVLEKSVLHVHSWEIGDIMFVNNKITLHDRLPYKGRRSMLRVRFDDSLHRNFHF